MRIRANGRTCLALVQVEAGLVSLAHVHQEADGSFMYLYQLRRLRAGEETCLLREPLPLACGDVRPVPHAGASRHGFHQRACYLALPELRARSRELHHRRACVEVRHHARQPVGLRVYEAAGICPAARKEHAPPFHGLRHAPPHEGCVRHRVRREAEHSHAYLRSGRPAPVAETGPLRVADGNRLADAWRSGHIPYCTREYPRMVMDGRALAAMIKRYTIYGRHTGYFPGWGGIIAQTHRACKWPTWRRRKISQIPH